jgi:DNA mismatch repair protein MSH3
VSDFYVSKRHSVDASEGFRSGWLGSFLICSGIINSRFAGKLLAAVVDFPKRVVVALTHIIKHLETFGIADALLETEFFDKFSSRVHMLLTANTLSNLEVYRNETDYTVYGSLLWVLDNTKTKFGARMLKHWIGKPLVDKR